MTTIRNPYKESIERNLPRIFSLFDTDISSSSYGVGDRFYWSWGLIDFGNGSFQGVAHGFSRLLIAGLLPEWVSETAIMERIDAMFVGANKLTRKDGSLEEAFPYEGSYCVTALVAFDLISSVVLLGDKLESNKKSQYISVVRPMIGYLLVADEHHAFISNHLATAAAALFKWEKVTGETVSGKAEEILERIYTNQSQESWFLEYDGADPGYQSLCCYYLADAFETTKDERLKLSLLRSIDFLQYFVHPDGSYGGLYGSRNTRLYYPAGFEYLAQYSPTASSIASYMRDSVEQNRVVGLDSIDEPNMTPMFNCYCWAAELCNKGKPVSTGSPLPFENEKFYNIYFEEAGIFINRGDDYYTIIGIHKGGVVYHFQDGKLTILDAGLLFLGVKEQSYSTQRYSRNNNYSITDNEISITSDIKPMSKRLFQPWQMIILRLLNISVMRKYRIREFIKKILVKILITRDGMKIGNNLRKIKLGYHLSIDDIYNVKSNVFLQKGVNQFVSIHMASKGYWQKQDTSE